jgi:ATP-dependent Clp protease adaptor protein ClpS
MTDRHGTRPGGHEEVAVEERTRTRKPRLYRVLLHNDDYTTMEFVVDVLVRHFRKSATEATQIMLQVHTQGMGVAGTYTREVAETKVARVTEEAREEGFPLLLTMEPE